MGAKASTARRFKVNPVEVAIFSVILLVFANSVYSLIYDQPGFKPNALSAVAANPLGDAGRAPAFSSQAFLNYDLKCEDSSESGTNASKVRISGPLCGMPSGTAESVQLLHTQIVNGTNRFNATVFTDLNTGKFSTDYIPLAAGRNTIHVEFSFSGGKSISKDIVVTKN